MTYSPQFVTEYDSTVRRVNAIGALLFGLSADERPDLRAERVRLLERLDALYAKRKEHLK